jgi:hypothetical protein
MVQSSRTEQIVHPRWKGNCWNQEAGGGGEVKAGARAPVKNEVYSEEGNKCTALSLRGHFQGSIYIDG